MALIQMVMPKMGESIMEGTILRWLKKVGDKIDQDESVLEVATDKVDTEVPALQSGYLMDILAKEGDVVQIGVPIAIISTTPLAVSNTPQPEVIEKITEEKPIEIPVESVFIEQQIETLVNGNNGIPPNGNGVETYVLTEPQPGRFYSPLVLTIAREEGITMQELEYIPGTGGDDRVTKRDILNYLAYKKGTPIQESVPVIEQPVYNQPVVVESYETKSTINLEKTPVTKPEPETVPIAETPVIQEEKVVDKILSIPLTKNTNNFISLEKPYAQKYEEVTPIEEEKIVAKEPEPVVENKIEEKKEEKPAETEYFPPQPEEPVSSPSVSVNGRVEIIEMDRMRKMIAQRMLDSKRISPHVTSFVEADVTNIVFWRNRVKHQFKEREGDAITFTPIFIEALAKALRDYPLINISVDGDKILVKKDINIGMAVALPNGNLIVPVIHNADQLNLVGLTKKVNDLARRARENKLKVEDLEGGTYTMSNIGSFGNVMGTPIIMQPQVAIMSFGAVQKKPAVIETPFGDTLGIRQLMFLSHSYDHRVIDGSLGGMFVRRVADYLENFDVNRKIF